MDLGKFAIGAARFNSTVPGNMYLWALATISAGSAIAYGTLRARRMS